MSGAKPIQRPPDNFDQVKLEGMTEPLSATVHRFKGSTKSKVPMPHPRDVGSDSEYPPGQGLSKDDVQGLETWIVTNWAGGGSYVFDVADSSTPPQTMRWTAHYPTDKYPERVPPPLQGAMPPSPVVAPIVPVPPVPTLVSPIPQVSQMAAFPGGLPNISNPMMPSTPAHPQQQAQPLFAPQPVYPGGWNPTMQSDYDRRSLEAKIMEMHALQYKERESAMQANFQRDLDNERRAANEKVAGLERSIQALMTKLETGPKVSPELEEARRRTEMLERKIEAEKVERDAERREQAMKDLIRQQADQTKAQMDQMNQQFQQILAMMREGTNKGPDPMMLLLIEQMKAQMDASKEIARENRATLERVTQSQLSPRELFGMVKEASTTSDASSKAVLDAMGNVVSFQNRVMENAMSMNSSPSKTVVDLVDGAVEKAASLAEKYALVKSQEAAAQSRANAQIAQAQAQAVTAQANALATQARAQAGEVIVTPAPKPQAQLSGPKLDEKKPEVPSAPKADAENQPQLKRVVEGLPPRTDEEWFLTPEILSHVKDLRAGVRRLLESLSQKPPRMKDGKFDGVMAEDCAKFIMQATAFVIQNNLPVPALVELLGEKRYQDFMTILLPDVPQGYIDDVIALVKPQMQQLEEPAEPAGPREVGQSPDGQENGEEHD